jgi:sulfur relay (sulfurtransferase) DsrC/TusE family protein
MLVELDDEQLGVVAEHAEATGRTIEDCLYQAMDDWIKTVAKTISQNEKFNITAMLLPNVLVN